MKKNTRTKHDLLIGDSEHFNLSLEYLVPKKKFSFSVNGSNNKAYGKLYNCSKSQNANIAVIEKRNPGSIDGTFYSSSKNPICDSDLVRGSNTALFYPGSYTLLNHTF
ncbi:hypothetical protein HYS72_02215 [Candidatus Pacearchaeota archaeon]|nr:hypothetical protein [Candidatus Pacearchaeota archaeon]MBI2056665.1 hypothetical protein [Candidatus Pacearchaeota archaeon]